MGGASLLETSFIFHLQSINFRDPGSLGSPFFPQTLVLDCCSTPASTFSLLFLSSVRGRVLARDLTNGSPVLRELFKKLSHSP